MNLPKIEVTAGLIIQDDTILIAQRPEAKYNGLWEFPGGKTETNESSEECLQRELSEELGINCVVGKLYIESEWQTDNKIIFLRTFCIESYKGEIQKRVHKDLKWVKLTDLCKSDFLPADKPVVDKLISTGL